MIDAACHTLIKIRRITLIRKGGFQTDKYNAYYRAAFDFHAHWKPCPKDQDAWIAAAQEMNALGMQGGNNPFLRDLLCAVYSELERQYIKRGTEEKCG